MMNGGQPIDPGLVQALGSISAYPEQTQALQQQMALAKQMRPNPMAPNAMAGKVVVRQSPLAAAANLGQNLIAGKTEANALQQQQANVNNLRDVRGQYISAQAALQNPSMLHPQSAAELANSAPTSELGTNPFGGAGNMQLPTGGVDE